MIQYKNNSEVELIRDNCMLVNNAIAHIASLIKPGVSTLELNDIVDQFIRDHGAIPSFKNYHGFPFACCMSVNDAIVHGFPTKEELKEGDIVSVDCGAFKNGFHSDTAYTFALANIDDGLKQLLRVTKESLYKGIEKAIVGNRVGDIAFAIQEHTEKKHGYGIVRELVGHGLGRELHEDPQVPNYGKRGSGIKLQDGLVIAIEPMINMGSKDVYNDEDGWTIRTKDGKPSAHFEHSVCVRKNKADILSSFSAIEIAEKSNTNLCSDY
ncbi:MAG: type I methionyl aminopeptidase [Bacteroidota bacterium]|jgi:methionyl aminopeptidase|nr:type I methionyl aminopeptidase [Bacteroidota bacterium]